MDTIGRLKYKKSAQKKKVHTYVSTEDIIRLEAIRDKFGFKSKYQILQDIIHCFLRVADPDNDTSTDPIPHEIESMFADFSEAEKSIMRKTKRQRKSPDDIKKDKQ